MQKKNFKSISLATPDYEKIERLVDHLKGKYKEKGLVPKVSMADVINLAVSYYSQREKLGEVATGSFKHGTEQ
jgi:hypothetical protein